MLKYYAFTIKENNYLDLPEDLFVGFFSEVEKQGVSIHLLRTAILSRRPVLEVRLEDKCPSLKLP